jgi:hypothetical protein
VLRRKNSARWKSEKANLIERSAFCNALHMELYTLLAKVAEIGA